jgi:hypothetical protein
LSLCFLAIVPNLPAAEEEDQAKAPRPATRSFIVARAGSVRFASTTSSIASSPNPAAGWSQGKDSFLKDPPNAALSIFSGDKVSDVVVDVSNPVLSGSNLTYNAKVLEGAASIRGGECSLFIDIIGCPRTPYSYAGAARRAYR